jgi:hypothetical protein
MERLESDAELKLPDRFYSNQPRVKLYHYEKPAEMW